MADASIKAIPPSAKDLPDELSIAEAIRDGILPSPQRYENLWLFCIRITGTGTAYREKHKEFCWRRPEDYLSERFLRRIQGLPVILDHPPSELLDSDEYHERNVGSVYIPFIRGTEIWAVVRIYDDATALILQDEQLSTSPAVVFRDPDKGKTLDIDGENHLLIEGHPAVVDHIALCNSGVWDRLGPPSGVDAGITLSQPLTTGRSDMAGPEVQPGGSTSGAPAEQSSNDIMTKLDSIAASLDSAHKRMDALERRRRDDDDDDRRRDDARRRRDDDDDDKRRRDDASARSDDDDDKRRDDSGRSDARKRKDKDLEEWAEEEAEEPEHKADRRRDDARRRRDDDDDKRRRDDSDRADARRRRDDAEGEEEQEMEREKVEEGRGDARRRRDDDDKRRRDDAEEEEEKERADARRRDDARRRRDDDDDDKRRRDDARRRDDFVSTRSGRGRADDDDDDDRRRDDARRRDTYMDRRRDDARADAATVRENAELRRRIADMDRALRDSQAAMREMHGLVSNITKETPVEERDALAAAQSRADAVAALFGERVPSPTIGVSSLAYRRQLLSRFLKHSEKFKDANISTADSNTLGLIENAVYADAKEASKLRADGQVGILIPRYETDAAGRTITRYDGDWLAAFGPFCRGGQRGRIAVERFNRGFAGQ